MKQFTYMLLIILWISPSLLYSQYKNRQQKREKIKKSINCSEGEYQLYWQDEFDGTQLDTSIWRTAYGNPKPWDCTLPRKECGTELQLYRDKNVVVSNGSLKLIAQKEAIIYKGIYGEDHTCANKIIGDSFNLAFDYTSGAIETKSDKIAFQYGRFEIRCRLPVGAGMWPAFWLWGGGGATGRAGEIDILEIFSTGQPTYTTSVHNGNKKLRVDKVIDWDIQDWHTYSAEWEPTVIKYYIDGQLIRTFQRFKKGSCADIPNISRRRSLRRNEAFPWKQWMVLRLNLALNPEAGMEVTSETPFPGRMEVDYVRVYKKSGVRSF